MSKKLRFNPPFPFDFSEGPKQFIEETLGLTYLTWERTGSTHPVYVEVAEESFDKGMLRTQVQNAIKPIVFDDEPGFSRGLRIKE